MTRCTFPAVDHGRFSAGLKCDRTATHVCTLCSEPVCQDHTKPHFNTHPLPSGEAAATTTADREGLGTPALAGPGTRPASGDLTARQRARSGAIQRRKEDA